MRPALPLFLSLIVFAAAALAEQAPEPPANPYTKNYVSRMPAPARVPSAAPQVFRGQDRVEDYQALLEDGYDLLGYASFEGAEVPPEQLTAHAASIHADLALVYTTRSGETPASVRLDQARAKAEKEKAQGAPAQPEALAQKPNKFYNYFASFWTKLPPPLLGVHVKQAEKAELPADGLEVIAVIKGSPAAAAGVQKGDTLLRLGEVELKKPELLTQAAQRYAGQQAELLFSRIGAEQRQPVTLNKR